MKSTVYLSLSIAVITLVSAASQLKEYDMPWYMHPFAHLMVRSMMDVKNKKTPPKIYKEIKSHASK